MKRKPWAIIVLALLHIIAPIGSFIFNAIRSGRTFSGQWYFWTHVLPPMFMVIYVALPILAGIFIYMCKRWSYWAYLGCLLIIFVTNMMAFFASMSWLNFFYLIAVLLVDLLAVAYFVVPAVRQVYFDPRLRWWEAAPRFVFPNPVRINGAEGEISNISKGGMFVRTSLNLFEDQTVSFEFDFEGTTYKGLGEVVFKSQRASNEGYGVQFKELDSPTAIRGLCSTLNSRGQMVPERLPGPEDSFGVWLKKLITERKGLIPKK
ncbi:PilZ domain-containing protein [Bdellovibrio sp. HCB209]|uniref:PilZ domain-containing protein n=1 Tax=Bdellovibrio sp. HCB209 TaxID=3394354 RepID=UPI0039B57AA2